jgi:hypothetical protein
MYFSSAEKTMRHICFMEKKTFIHYKKKNKMRQLKLNLLKP